MERIMRNLIAGIVFGVFACGVAGQAFPIRAVGEPVYPDDVGIEWFEWYSGTLDRVGDVNGDGVDDLVVLMADDSKLASNRSMWLYVANEAEDGSISFGAPERLAGFDLEGDYISDFAIHDHNGDGLNDLLFVTDQRHDLEVWINSPVGFVLGMTLHNGLDGTVEGQHILIEDIDQDGDQDYLLVSPDYSEGGIWTKQTNENFTYEPVGFNGSFFEYPSAVFDLEGDGDIDLVNLYDQHISAIKPTADGWAEDDVSSELVATNFRHFGQGQIFADVNGDGVEDVVIFGEAEGGEDDGKRGFGFFLAPFEIGDWDPKTGDYEELEPREIPYFVFQRFENEYSQSFEEPDFWELMLSSPGDLDGDGTDDLIYYPFEGKTSGWQIFDPLNQNGRRAVVPAMSVHGEGKLTRDMDIDFDRYAYRDAYMDINGDGVKDRLVATAAERGVAMDVWNESDFGLMVWGVLSNPFDKRMVLEEQDAMTRWNLGSMSHVIAADLDLDNDPEILVNVGSIRLFDRDEAGLFGSPDFPRFFGARGGFLTIVAQFDDDPRPDIVTMGIGLGRGFPGVHQNPDMSEERMYPIDSGPNPDSRFNHWDELEKLGTYFQSNDSSVDVGDVDGDGWDDIVMRGEVGIEDGHHGDAVLVWINDPDGYFTVGPITPVRDLFSARTLNIGLVDADNDGDLDLVSVGDEDIESGHVLGVHLNDGTGAFVLDREIPIHDVFGGVPYWFTVEDLDGDGFEDVMVLLQDTDDLHEVAVVYGSVGGLAQEPVYLVGGNAAEVLAVDLDGNGLRDVLTCSYQSGGGDQFKNSISILFQVEPRVFMPMVSIDDLDLSGVNVADMNRDGVDDLIACSNRTSGLDVDDVVRVFYSVPGVCRADLNLDGHLDFFDISLFLKMLGERRPLADLSGDGGFDVQDVIEFLKVYGDGCLGGE